MKQILVCIGIMIALSFQAPQQQPPTITITVTLDEANLIVEGLGELPAKKSAGLIQKVVMQANQQLQPPKADSTKPKKQ